MPPISTITNLMRAMRVCSTAPHSVQTESFHRRKAVGVIAVVGRPNVGKSTLVNRILGRRAAVVEDTPGVTRDRVSYDAEWAGTDFKLVDTGGWEADVEGIDSAIASQAQIAVELADSVIFVVDALTGSHRPTSAS